MLNVILSLILRYVDQFSRCLYVEYKSKGIDVQCQVTTILYAIDVSCFSVEPNCTYFQSLLVDQF